MRRTATLFICLMAFNCCHAQDSIKERSYTIGIGLNHPVMNGCVSIGFGHSISRHWSVGGEALIGLPGIRKEISEDEKTHEDILSETKWIWPAREADSASMEISHWPWETFKKGFITLGCSYGDRKGLDCTIGAGYMMDICKGMAVTLKAETGILNMRKMELWEMISINLNYIF